MMASKWLNLIPMTCVIQCLWFTITGARPYITLNGSASTPQTLQLNDTLKIRCTVSSSYTSISSFYVQRGGSNYKYLGNSKEGSVTKTVTCDDNTYFRCYGRFNGTYMYSINIYVKVNCSPTWAESVQTPVLFYSTQVSNKYFDMLIIGQPQPTYSVQKYTPSGLQDLPVTVDITRYTGTVRLYFRSFSEESHGIYHIKANNSIGMLTTNVTLRGYTLPPKFVRAWSTTPNSIHVEWTAGELFESKPRYYVYYKSQVGKWVNSVSFYNLGLTMTHIFNSFQTNTTYYFLIIAAKYGTSVYSNMAQATTLTNSADPPQTKPPIYLPDPASSTGRPPIGTQSTTEPELTTEIDGGNDINKGLKPESLTFEVGIGIGIGIGLILVIIAVMGTVIFFKSVPEKHGSPMATQNRPTESETGRMYINIADGPYAQLSHTNTGCDNQ